MAEPVLTVHQNPLSELRLLAQDLFTKVRREEVLQHFKISVSTAIIQTNLTMKGPGLKGNIYYGISRGLNSFIMRYLQPL